MPQYLAPGVYVQEVPSGIRSIEGVSTSITAFVGRCQRGPLDTPVSVRSFHEFENSFGGFWKHSELPYAASDFFENGGKEALVVRIANGATTVRFSLPSSRSKEPPLLLESANPGAWGKQLVISSSEAPHNGSLFSLTVYDPSTKQSETFDKLSCRPKSKYFIPKVLNRSSNLIRVVRENRKWQIPNSRPAPQSKASVVSGFGTDGRSLVADNFSHNRHKRRRTGLYALKKADIVNLLYIPPYKSDGSIEPTLVTDAASFCEQNQVFLILDPPPAWNDVQSAAAQSQALATSSKNAAVFFPRIQKLDPLDPPNSRDAAPGGSIAGIFARIDTTRGVWKAPAGVKVNGATGLALDVSSADQNLLNPQAINCVRRFPNRGILLWGARTLQGRDSTPSDWRYIPIRRLALHIESSLIRGTQWAVFEPNDANLWSSIRSSVSNFLHQLWREGAFPGATANESFFVRCDRSTMTQADLDSGRLVIQVGFAPLKPAEFIMLQLSQKTAS